MSSKIDIQKALEKEIDLIQSCIKRMSQHSFYLKGWLISLIILVLSLISKSNNIIFINIILIIATIIFWYLDALFLRFERMYRKLYNWVIFERLNDNEDLLYDLNLHRFELEVPTLIKTMFSKTLGVFYCIPLISLIIFLLYNFFPIIKQIICTCK